MYVKELCAIYVRDLEAYYKCELLNTALDNFAFRVCCISSTFGAIAHYRHYAVLLFFKFTSYLHLGSSVHAKKIYETGHERVHRHTHTHTHRQKTHRVTKNKLVCFGVV